jgi:large subunit ribosomal protein L15
MQLNTLAPVPGSVQEKKRVGRGIGSGFGKTCGRGHKGQKSRSGGSVRPGFEGGQMPLQKRLPKFGFYSRIGSTTSEVRTSELNKVEGGIINLESLEKANVIDRNTKRVKIMLSGDVTQAVTIEGLGVSKGAKSAIEAAGGKVIEAEVPTPGKKTKKKAAEKTESKKAEKKAAPKAKKVEEAAKEEVTKDEAPAEDTDNSENNEN